MVESFRVAVHKQLYFIDELIDSPPAFDECPTYCGTLEEKRETFCEGCPAKRQQDRFKEQLEEALDEELGERWKEYEIGMLLRTVREVQSVKETDSSQWTITTAVLVGVYQEEEAKKSRIENYEKMKELEALINK